MDLGAAGFDGTQLAVFTTLTPAAAAALMLLAAVLLLPSHAAGRLLVAGGNGADAAWEESWCSWGGLRARLSHAMCVPLAVAWLGFIVSATHLGTPANALYAFSGVGRSPLSNEVAAVTAFLLLSGVWWLSSFGERPGRARRSATTGLLLLAVLTAAAAIAGTARAYGIETVPTWNTWHAPACLLCGALCAGSALAAATLVCALPGGKGAEWIPGARGGLQGKRRASAHGTPAVTACVLLVAAGGVLLLAAVAAYGIHLNGVGNNVVPRPPHATPAVVAALAACAVCVPASCALLSRSGRASRAATPAAAGKTAGTTEGAADRSARAPRWRRRAALACAGALLACFGVAATRFAFYAIYLSAGF